MPIKTESHYWIDERLNLRGYWEETGEDEGWLTTTFDNDGVIPESFADHQIVFVDWLNKQMPELIARFEKEIPKEEYGNRADEILGKRTTYRPEPEASEYEVDSAAMDALQRRIAN